MQEKDFYLYIDGQPVQVSGEVYQEYYRAEDKERYFMGKLKKGRTKVNPETQEIQYIPSRELSYEQLVEQDWQFAVSDDSVEDRAVRADMLEKLQDVLQSLSAEELALLNELFYLEKTEREPPWNMGRYSCAGKRFMKRSIRKRRKGLPRLTRTRLTAGGGQTSPQATMRCALPASSWKNITGSAGAGNSLTVFVGKPVTGKKMFL